MGRPASGFSCCISVIGPSRFRCRMELSDTSTFFSSDTPEITPTTSEKHSKPNTIRAANAPRQDEKKALPKLIKRFYLESKVNNTVSNKKVSLQARETHE